MACSLPLDPLTKPVLGELPVSQGLCMKLGVGAARSMSSECPTMMFMNYLVVQVEQK